MGEEREGALIAYVMGGDPDVATTPGIIDSVVRGGADIIEIGIPFSDPIADGKSIQGAGIRSLGSGTKPKDVLEIIRSSRQIHPVPFVIMTYFNILHSQGVESFLADAGRAGVDGVIIPDLPLDEVGGYSRMARDKGMDMILLAAPTTSPERMKTLVKNTSGFLYLVSLLGVTGARVQLAGSTLKLVQFAKRYTKGKVPLGVGFGISKPEHVGAVIKAGADGAIVGSGIVDLVEKHQHDGDVLFAEIERYVRQLKSATKR